MPAFHCQPRWTTHLELKGELRLRRLTVAPLHPTRAVSLEGNAMGKVIIVKTVQPSDLTQPVKDVETVFVGHGRVPCLHLTAAERTSSAAARRLLRRCRWKTVFAAAVRCSGCFGGFCQRDAPATRAR